MKKSFKILRYKESIDWLTHPDVPVHYNLVIPPYLALARPHEDGAWIIEFDDPNIVPFDNVHQFEKGCIIKETIGQFPDGSLKVEFIDINPNLS